jgi:hypothetical protein
MKKVLTILIFIFGATYSLRAQGDLQFNQVINTSVTGSISANSSSNLGTITVPAGKVWKVETATVLRGNEIERSIGRIGNYLVFSHIPGNGYYTETFLPLWLSPGTYNLNVVNNSSSGPFTYRMSISAIEFNVITE